jgi:hypothetical protein
VSNGEGFQKRAAVLSKGGQSGTLRERVLGQRGDERHKRVLVGALARRLALLQQEIVVVCGRQFALGEWTLGRVSNLRENGATGLQQVYLVGLDGLVFGAHFILLGLLAFPLGSIVLVARAVLQGFMWPVIVERRCEGERLVQHSRGRLSLHDWCILCPPHACTRMRDHRSGRERARPTGEKEGGSVEHTQLVSSRR